MSGNTAAGPIDERVAEYLRRADLAPTATRVEPLHGDASSRAYVRVTPTGGPPVVLVLHPEPFAADALPQVVVGALFRRLGIPIPSVLDQAADLGILAVEDLGDETLQSWMEGGDDRDPAPLYRQAIGHIATLQTRGASLRTEGALPFHLAFDAAKLTWELDFFRSEFLEAHRRVGLSPAEAGALGRELAALATELAAEPRVLCHRDYHCRNLMVRNGRLIVIDFQDARLGPGTYDLVSLLRDCYVDLPGRPDGRADPPVPRRGARATDPRLPGAFRPDVGTTAPEGPGHVRSPDRPVGTPPFRRAGAPHPRPSAPEPAGLPALRSPPRGPCPARARTRLTASPTSKTIETLGIIR